jgi:hypothetical protein
MKAFPNSTIHYRNSICTITAVQITLTYVIKQRIHGGTTKCGDMISDHHTLRRTIYSQYNQPKLIYIGSIASRPLLEKQCSVCITDGKANSLVS